MMLTTQSSHGRISLVGIRNVRQAATEGDQVQRADVLALITAHLELMTEAAETMAKLKRIEAFHEQWGKTRLGDVDPLVLWSDLGRLLKGKQLTERVPL